VDISNEMAHLLAQAERGDASVLPALRTYLDQTPELWQSVGDLSYQAQAALIERASGANLLLQESLGRQLEAMRQELSGPAPTPLERLLVDRIVLCWLRVSIAEVLEAQAPPDRSPRQAESSQTQIDRAHRRFVEASKAWAQVRRLLSPVVQVNIAKQQVNVAP
jgi:hypothetical protein